MVEPLIEPRLLKRLRADNHPVAFRIKLRDQLDLVALGTIADLVPLQGENRILARNGLRILEATERPGLRALMDVAGVRPGARSAVRSPAMATPVHSSSRKDAIAAIAAAKSSASIAGAIAASAVSRAAKSEVVP